MMDGWFCRSIANEQHQTTSNDQTEQEYANLGINSESSESVKLTSEKARYKNLKKKFKFLIYENEFLLDTLRSSQRRFLKVSRDRNFLLDRLMQYEKPETTSTDDDDTDTSDEEEKSIPKKRKANDGNNMRNVNMGKRKRAAIQRPIVTTGGGHSFSPQSMDVTMTVEEVERHLSSRQSLIELPIQLPTVPNEMFSNEPSLDSDQLVVETSPSHLSVMD